jgi:hypothetical protein
MSETARNRFVRNLAAAFHAREWSAKALRESARLATGLQESWLTTLVRRVLSAHPQKPAVDDLLAFLKNDRGLNVACVRMYAFASADEYFPVRTLFFAVESLAPRPTWATSLPDLPNTDALAAWLELTPGRLKWLADLSGRNRRHPAGPLRTYRYRWVSKRSGKRRLLEIPTPLLKAAQRKLLCGLLNHVPVHPSVHGFRPGCSVVTNAAVHCGREVVLKFDLADFFPSVMIGRVFALFRTLGYPRAVAKVLAGLCTTRLPHDAWEARPNPALDGTDHPHWQRFLARHLPQGAPTSPAIANLVAYRLDCRLSALAAILDATYTRYADDLTLSGSVELARSAKRVTTLVTVICAEEGFTLNLGKTRVLRQSERQTVTGVVVNTRPNLPRSEFDLLKAVLTNCVRRGPVGQNREKHPNFRAHLTGKVAQLAAINPARGRRLWELLDRISWEELEGKNA